MPAVPAIIPHGDIPSANMADESGLLVQSFTWTGSRESKEYKGANKAVKGVEETNPTLSGSCEAYITNYAGMASYHPGQEIVSLANFATPVFQFVPGDGTIIFREPSITESIDDVAKMSFTVVVYPFV